MGTPVRAKKAKKPAQSIRYLLSANPKFERISLRRLSQPVRSVKKRQPDRQTDSTRASRLFVLAAMLVTTIGVLMAARGPSRQADVAAGVATVSAQPTKGSAPANATALTNATMPTNAAAKPDKTEAREIPKAVAPKAAVRNASTVESMKPTAVESPPKTVAVVESPGKTPPAESPVNSPAMEPTAKSVQDSSPVTITGCLKFDEETFWLTDATGEESLKSRSWKWGFLKKRSSNIELIDASHTLRLPNYVDQRVTATGMLTRREMRAQSLQRIAGSCS
jgi:hypothetical protein